MRLMGHSEGGQGVQRATLHVQAGRPSCAPRGSVCLQKDMDSDQTCISEDFYPPTGLKDGSTHFDSSLILGNSLTLKI